jgi:hypothetical protein
MMVVVMVFITMVAWGLSGSRRSRRGVMTRPRPGSTGGAWACCSRPTPRPAGRARSTDGRPTSPAAGRGGAMAGLLSQVRP